MRNKSFCRELGRYIDKGGRGSRRIHTASLCKQIGIKRKTLELWILGRSMPTRIIQLRVLDLLEQLNA